MDAFIASPIPIASLQQQETITLSGRTSLDYVHMEIPADSNLVGNRWLTRDGSLFIVAPSSHGKSSFAIALMIHFAIGRAAFGLKPAQPLRILLIESEDDDADNKAFVQVLHTMNLSRLELELLETNTRIEFRRDLCGERFFKALNQFLTQYPADAVIINPLTGFYPGSLNDDEAVSRFLRQDLNSVMVNHKCAPIIIAHMPKSQITQLADKEWYEWMYVLSGCASITNWARAILVFVPTIARGTYRFICAKRFAQSGLVQPDFWLSHCTSSFQLNGTNIDIVSWIPATSANIALAQPEPKKRKRTYTRIQVWEKMSPLTEYSREQFRLWCKETFSLGSNSSDDIRKALIDEELISVIEPDDHSKTKFKKNNPST